MTQQASWRSSAATTTRVWWRRRSPAPAASPARSTGCSTSTTGRPRSGARAGPAGTGARSASTRSRRCGCTCAPAALPRAARLSQHSSTRSRSPLQGSIPLLCFVPTDGDGGGARLGPVVCLVALACLALGGSALGASGTMIISTVAGDGSASLRRRRRPGDGRGAQGPRERVGHARRRLSDRRQDEQPHPARGAGRDDHHRGRQR